MAPEGETAEARRVWSQLVVPDGHFAMMFLEDDHLDEIEHVVLWKSADTVVIAVPFPADGTVVDSCRQSMVLRVVHKLPPAPGE
jgi:hypothetical protein